jgi:hypothetical protein
MSENSFIRCHRLTYRKTKQHLAFINFRRLESES